jgi:hypothetical protein
MPDANGSLAITGAINVSLPHKTAAGARVPARRGLWNPFLITG